MASEKDTQVMRGRTGETGAQGEKGKQGEEGTTSPLAWGIVICLAVTLILVVFGLNKDNENTKKQNAKIERELQAQRVITDQLEGVGHVGPCRAALKEQVVKLPQHPTHKQKAEAVTRAIRDPECQQQSRLLFLSFCDQFDALFCDQLGTTIREEAAEKGTSTFLTPSGSSPRSPVKPPPPNGGSVKPLKPTHPAPNNPGSPGAPSNPSTPSNPPAIQIPIPDVNAIIDAAQQQLQGLTKSLCDTAPDACGLVAPAP